MKRTKIIPLLFAITAAVQTASVASAQNAQEFLINEMRGDHDAQRIQQSQRPAAMRPRHSERQNEQVAITGLNLGGSWLTSNMGATRPQGAPGAWCGYAMRMEMISQGYGDPGQAFNHVSHWCKIGSPAPVGAVGSIFVSRGHVSKVVAGNCPPGRVATISGNASGRRVSIMCEPVSRIVCSRWPGRAQASLNAQ